MKKYLLITQRCPYPPHKNGGVHTIYNIIKNVPSDVELDVFYYYERDLEAEQVIKRFVHKIEYKKLYKMPNKFTRMKNFISGIPDYYSEVDLKKIDVEIDYDKYDVVILDQIYSLPFAEYIPRDVSIISMMHDNNAMLYERKANAEKLFVKKFYDRKQSEYFKKVEEKYFNKIKKVIYVSDLDATRSQSEHKNCTCKFDNIILGVDLPENNQFSNAKENSIVFSGVMDYGPNEDAAYYFATEVYPAIKEKINDAEFVIAGKNPTQKLVDLKCKNIHITGFVDDMYRTISSSEIYVSPLRYGSGTKNKVLEAMAVGMPVFLTDVSREGIDGLQDGQNCFFVDKNNMAEVISKALTDKVRLKKVAERGKEYVERYHSWKNAFDKFLID